MDYSQFPFPKGVVRLEGATLGLLRLQCLQRDKGRCCECHALVSDDLPEWHPLKYDMAHIRNKRMHGDTIDNVRTLCHGCHMKEHNGQITRPEIRR